MLCVKYGKNLLMALEEMSFENVDNGRLYKIMLHYLILRYIDLSVF